MATMWVKTASAMGERQILPRQTNRTEILVSGIVWRAEGGYIRMLLAGSSLGGRNNELWVKSMGNNWWGACSRQRRDSAG